MQPADLEAENERLSRESAALRTETRRLTLAVDAANAELRRLVGMDPIAVRSEAVQLMAERDMVSAAVRGLEEELAELRGQLVGVRETITRLGRTLDIRISPEYHAACLAEVRLTAEKAR